MVTPKSSGKNVPSKKTVNKADVEIAKAKADLKVALNQAKSEQLARQKAEKALTEGLEDLSIARSDLEQERQARVEAIRELDALKESLGASLVAAEQERQARFKTDQENTEARIALEVLKPIEKMSSGMQEITEGEQRISFVLRLTVDEKGHTKRTEIEHAQSGKKDVFPSLNIDRLVGFINACIVTIEVEEDVTSRVTKESGKESPTYKMPATGITIGGLQTESINNDNKNAVVFEPDKAFWLRTSFKLHGVEQVPTITKNVTYEITVYACGIDQKLNTQVARYSSNLVEGVLDYTVRMEVPGLSAGIYRLSTLVKILEPINAVSFYEGTIFEVARSQEMLAEVAPYFSM